MWETESSSRSIHALLRPIQSNDHSFLFFALPPLPGSCRLACLNWSPAPGRGRRRRFGRFAAAGVRAACLRFHFLVPLSRSSLVRYRCRARFPFDGAYDDPALDRFRLSPAGVAWRLLMRIVCGEQIGTARLSNIASSLVPPRPVPSLIGLPLACLVIGDIRPASRIAGRGGLAGRLCLLTAVGSFSSASFLSSACSFLVCRRPSSSIHRHVGCLCLLRRYRVLLSSPSRSSCRPSACFASLRYSPRPATRRAGRCLA